jgi:hypothetical protein
MYLGRHNFRIGACNVDTGIETGPVVSFDNVPTVYLIGPNAAIVGTLGYISIFMRVFQYFTRICVPRV